MIDLLYPRLPPAVARQLFTDYSELTVRELSALAELSHPDAVYAPLGGTQVASTHLRDLAAEVREVATEAGYPDARGGQDQLDRFDVGCAETLQTKMGIAPAEAASVDLWAFLGVVVLPDVCFWRFPRPPADRVIGPDLTRHTLARLWWRAYQLGGLDGQDSLAALRAIPESEMNQLFERRSIGGNTALVRAVALQLMNPSPAFATVQRRSLVRDSALRIRRLAAFCQLEGLVETQMITVINAVFADSAAALATEGPVVGPSDGGEAVPSAAKPNSGENPDGGEPPASDQPPATDFEDVALADIPVQIAEVVSSRGGVSDDQLIAAYEQRFHVRVPAGQHDLLRRFAWSARGRHFIELDEENGVWLPGGRAPQRIEPLGEWTLSLIRRRAIALLRSAAGRDPFDQLLAEVYRSDGGRVPRFVMSLTGHLLKEARREVSGAKNR